MNSLIKRSEWVKLASWREVKTPEEVVKSGRVVYVSIGLMMAKCLMKAIIECRSNAWVWEQDGCPIRVYAGGGHPHQTGPRQCTFLAVKRAPGHTTLAPDWRLNVSSLPGIPLRLSAIQFSLLLRITGCCFAVCFFSFALRLKRVAWSNSNANFDKFADHWPSIKLRCEPLLA